MENKTFPRKETILLGQKQGKSDAGNIFVYYKGLIHYKFIPEEYTVNKNKKLYIEILL